ncbi:MAG: 4-hydroxy-3-methylbut-2-enyl diphosphate reductase [Treponemataceae bacterium]
MKVVRAKKMGYCMGVKCAVEKAEKALDSYPEKTIYTLGPLIHNKTALDVLEKKGLKILKPENVENFDEKESVVVIRAHGISPKLRRCLEKNGSQIVDATCPRVLSSQKRALDYSSRSFFVIIAGDKNHGEVTGIQGVVQDSDCKLKILDCNSCVKNCSVVENEEQAKEVAQYLFEQKVSNAVILSQTTFSPSEYEKIVKAVKDKLPNVEVLNTICPATEERQNALSELCLESDIVIVVGGFESANTCRLYQIAQNYCKDPAYCSKFVLHVEDYEDFYTVKSKIYDFLSKNKDIYPLPSDVVVGITAGASTPEDSIQKIINTLLSDAFL